MKLSQDIKRKGKRPGLTLIEMSVVILVLLSLTGAFFASAGSIGNWQKQKEAESVLRDVEVAQVEFLANNPQRAVDTLTDGEVAGYLPGSPLVLPNPKDLDGNPLSINVGVSPPVLMSGGSEYHF